MLRYVLAGSVKDSQLQKFRDWLKANKEVIAKAAPPGWRLKGIYFSVYGFGDQTFEVHWNLDNYAAFDSAVDESAKTERTKDGWHRLQGEWFEFLQLDTVRGRLLKPADDAQLRVVAS